MVKLETVQDYLAAGLAVIPVSQEEDALPLEQEKAQHLPTEDEIMTSFSEEQNAVGLVCGETSGNLEIISFDKNFEKWKNTISPELFAKLVVEQTPSGGYHVAYRCKESASESCFLAEEMHDDEPVPLIKLHGKGDCVVCSPTNGYKLIQGDYTALPCLDGTGTPSLRSMDSAAHRAFTHREKCKKVQRTDSVGRKSDSKLSADEGTIDLRTAPQGRTHEHHCRAQNRQVMASSSARHCTRYRERVAGT